MKEKISHQNKNHRQMHITLGVVSLVFSNASEINYLTDRSG